MKKGDVVYFQNPHFSGICAEKGIVKVPNIDGTKYSKINWVNKDTDFVYQGITMPNNLLFSIEEECIEYYQNIKKEKLQKLYDKLDTKEAILSFLLDHVRNNHGSTLSNEQKIIQKRIKELFNLDISIKE